MKNLTENARKFLAKNPTVLGMKYGYTFYECPTNGDEAPIKMITPEGKYKTTDCWDMESIYQWLDEITTFTRVNKNNS